MIFLVVFLFILLTSASLVMRWQQNYRQCDKIDWESGLSSKDGETHSAVLHAVWQGETGVFVLVHFSGSSLTYPKPQPHVWSIPDSKNVFYFLYCPCLSSIHEKANCIAVVWTGCPQSLGRVAISKASRSPVFCILNFPFNLFLMRLGSHYLIAVFIHASYW